nr:hypothetical protein [uncultured Campylobacter sp.]
MITQNGFRIYEIFSWGAEADEIICGYSAHLVSMSRESFYTGMKGLRLRLLKLRLPVKFIKFK